MMFGKSRATMEAKKIFEEELRLVKNVLSSRKLDPTVFPNEIKSRGKKALATLRVMTCKFFPGFFLCFMLALP